MVLLISQLTVEVAPTAAVACVPREPTMAVSMYCTAVCISCSSMVGQARVRITRIMGRLIRWLGLACMVFSVLCRVCAAKRAAG